MSISNLALVFAPSLFGTLDADLSVRKELVDPMSMAKESKFTSMVTEELLTEAEFLFDGEGEPVKAYEATECFKSLNQKHVTLLRGDTFVVLHCGLNDATILIGESTGKIPLMILSTMKEISLTDVKTREIITLFASRSSKPAGIRVGNVVEISPASSRKNDIKKNRRKFTDVLRFNANISKRNSMIVSPRSAT